MLRFFKKNSSVMSSDSEGILIRGNTKVKSKKLTKKKSGGKSEKKGQKSSQAKVWEYFIIYVVYSRVSLCLF